MIYILYSGDYEIYMAANRLSETQVMVDPTKRLLAVLDDIGIPITCVSPVSFRRISISLNTPAMCLLLRPATGAS